MFKKLLCMTALSLAFASSPEAYSAGNYSELNYSQINVSNNNTNRTTSVFNNTVSQNSRVKSSLALDIISIVWNIIAPVVGDVYFCIRPIISQCCASCGNPNHSFCKLVKYLEYKTESSTRNKIMASNFEKIVFNNWVTLFVSVCSVFSIINGWAGVVTSLSPLTLIGFSRLGTDIYYTVQYKCSIEQQLYNNLEEDIAYLHALHDNNHPVRDFIFGITEDNKRLERKHMFKSLIRRGQFSELLNRQFTFDQMLDAGVRPNFLQDNVVQLQPQYTQIIRLQTAIVKKDAVAQHWQDHEVQAALQAVLLVVLLTAGAHPNVLQNAITEQHNAGQDAALQALRDAIAYVQGHVVQPVQDAGAHPVQIAIGQFVQAAGAQPAVLRDVLEAVLFVALQTAGVHPNVLQDAITEQHNAGQDATLQALRDAIAPLVP